jgi:hypothetical protein
MSEEHIQKAALGAPQVVETVPLIPFKVVETDIPFYRDIECKDLVEDAHIIILQALDPDDQILEQELVPTTQRYKKGDYVTMNLDSKKLWEDSWFKSPLTGKVEKAWEIHVNFVGDLVSEAAVQSDRARIQDLEKRIEERMSISTSDLN